MHHNVFISDIRNWELIQTLSKRGFIYFSRYRDATFPTFFHDFLFSTRVNLIQNINFPVYLQHPHLSIPCIVLIYFSRLFVT